MSVRQIAALAVFSMTTLMLTSCGAEGPVKATKAIKMGERFYNNWEGTKVGQVDSFVLLSSYAAHDINAGETVKQSDIMQAVNVDVEWLKGNAFTDATDPTLKLKTMRGSKVVIERNGKIAQQGVCTFDSGMDTNCLSVDLADRKVQLFGARSAGGKRRFLIGSTGNGRPEHVWIEETGADKNGVISSSKRAKRNRV